MDRQRFWNSRRTRFAVLFFWGFLFLGETTDATSNYALRFNGTNFVYLGTDNRLNPRNEYTIEAWTLLEKSSSWRWVFSRWNQNVEGTYILGIHRSKYWFVNWSSQRDIYSIDPFTIGEWVHLAATYNNGTVALYRDGILQEKRNAASADATNVATLIGNIYLNNEISTGWVGLIDEVRFWGIARTQEEIRETMHTPLTGQEPGLIGYWDFNEGQGKIAMDKGPHGLHGTLGSDGSDVPVWVVSDSPVSSDPPDSEPPDADLVDIDPVSTEP